MPRVFVYEHVTAVGLGRDPGSPDHSLHVEGRAMLNAISADFAAVPDVEVMHFPADLPEPDLLPRFRELARRANWSFVIAPETGGELERLAREVVSVGGRLLGPSPDAIALTADKLRLAEWWVEHGVRTPRTWEAPPTRNAARSDLPLKGGGVRNTSPLEGEVGEPKARRVGGVQSSLVLKPRDGAGSESTFLVRTPAEFDAALTSASGPMVAQEFVPGRPASVAYILGPSARVPLKPTLQTISTDGRFKYEGGELLSRPDLMLRALQLGATAIDCVPGLVGYVGVDLILGDAADGSGDFAIEINPRLTTSYVGLRAATKTNLAAAMLAAAAGEWVSAVGFRNTPVRWKPDGQVGVVAG